MSRKKLTLERTAETRKFRHKEGQDLGEASEAFIQCTNLKGHQKIQ